MGDGGLYPWGERGLGRKRQANRATCIIYNHKNFAVQHSKQHCGSGTSQSERPWIHASKLNIQLLGVEN